MGYYSDRNSYYGGYCHDDRHERLENGMYVNPTKEHQIKARLAALETFPITTTPGAVQIGDTSAGILVPVDGGKIAVVAALTVKEFAPRNGTMRHNERKPFDMTAPNSALRSIAARPMNLKRW